MRAPVGHNVAAGARRPPALVISLDFELHWGVRDVHGPTSAYMAQIRGAREAIPRILDLFVEFDVAATWATVGYLFAESRDELESFHPVSRPSYRDARLDPYTEPVGRDEAEDPLHFAPSLLRLIASAPRQEIATHTYSHYYCLEPGATPETFRADLASAVAIAAARGIDIRSIVLPRNQWNPGFAPILSEAGIECYRGNQSGWMYDATAADERTSHVRAARLADAHVALTRWHGMAWDEVRGPNGLNNVGATAFLRPVTQWPRGLASWRLARIAEGIARSASRNRVFHLWWHPHNFGSQTAENLAVLRRILERYRAMSAEYGMRSMSMIEVARGAAVVAGNPVAA
jgi:peptidoglycan/xylan/chitin deacetylase (PgdA/CDA1 family)